MVLDGRASPRQIAKADSIRTLREPAVSYAPRFSGGEGASKNKYHPFLER